jgi:O-antigen/teichoic acid export membrane protein
MSGGGHRALRFGRRMGWGVADQGLSSLTNFVIGIVVARTLGLEGFGAFGLAFVAYQIVVGLARAVVAQPLLIRYSGVETDRWRRGAAAGAGMSLLIALLSVPILVLVGVLTTGSIREAFLALAIVLPGMIVQDAWRFAFFADHRGRSAFVNDLLWGVFQIAALTLAASVGATTVWWAVLAWGGGATIAALLGVIQAGVAPRITASRAWTHEHRDLLPPYIGEFAAQILAGQLMLYSIGWIAGLAAVGALRGANVLLGPIHVIVQGTYLVAVPEAVHLLRTDLRKFVAFCIGASAVLGAVGIGWTAMLVLIPQEFGVALLGEVWDAALEIVPIWGVAFAVVNLAAGAAIGLRAMAAARRTLNAAAVASVGSFAGANIGALAGGVVGAAWGYLATWVVSLGWWWWQFRLGLDEYRDALLPGVTRSATAAPEAVPPIQP